MYHSLTIIIVYNVNYIIIIAEMAVYNTTLNLKQLDC